MIQMIYYNKVLFLDLPKFLLQSKKKALGKSDFWNFNSWEFLLAFVRCV